MIETFNSGPQGEMTPTDRANLIGAIFQEVDSYDGVAPAQAVLNILADVMHYCDQQGIDFAEREQRARDPYRKEKAELGVATKAA